MEKDSDRLKKPDWLKVKLPDVEEYSKMKHVLGAKHLHTICESGACPNKGECWGAGTATFMILGNICTRSCRFCNVETGKPLPPDKYEPLKVAEAVLQMNLKHVVLTSVDRDDLSDSGACHWSQTIKIIKNISPETTIEALIPDMKGNVIDLQTIMSAEPDIISHNLETVKRLSKEVRVKADYDTSLRVIGFISESGIPSKSGIMLGLGETDAEVLETMDDLFAVGCRIITLGQYLQPTHKHLPVKRYVSPEQFDNYKTIAFNKGFKFVESAPLVRSSYRAERHINKSI
ncbi:MAG: lipoyl synthase [Bacteroidetes bacterium]|nr:lipoyl synthase [Bacteroidota bacterium]